MDKCITLFENGEINWSTGKVTALGKASPKGNKEGANESVPGSARADASRNIIDILKQIKITNTMTVDQYASQNDIILAGIEKRPGMLSSPDNIIPLHWMWKLK